MAYTKNIWATGDTVTAEKLNHAEDGIAAANNSVSFEIGFDPEESKFLPTIIDLTYEDAVEILGTGGRISFYSKFEQDGELFVARGEAQYIGYNDGKYLLAFFYTEMDGIFAADTKTEKFELFIDSPV